MPDRSYQPVLTQPAAGDGLSGQTEIDVTCLLQSLARHERLWRLSSVPLHRRDKPTEILNWLYAGR